MFDWGSLLKGVGSLAGAYATYKTGKDINQTTKNANEQMNKLEREKFDYQKELNNKSEKKNNLAQANMDGAIASVYGEPTLGIDTNKKKKTTDVSLAYGTPSTEV
ncbi:MAG: hypothetical protein RBT59_10530 [Arcobacteraceae bacterium]|jgi:hypothetical protein|nr:hypothetical protein [Arcobacteraceae bacterium]